MRERLQGARLAVAGHPDASLDVVWSARTTAELGKALGAEIAAAPPELRPDGIITTNDHLACGVVFGLISNGVRVPDEIAVIGYDDIEFASVAAVPLTSVRQPAREMGRLAGELPAPPDPRRRCRTASARSCSSPSSSSGCPASGTADAAADALGVSRRESSAAGTRRQPGCRVHQLRTVARRGHDFPLRAGGGSEQPESVRGRGALTVTPRQPGCVHQLGIDRRPLRRRRGSTTSLDTSAHTANWATAERRRASAGERGRVSGGPQHAVPPVRQPRERLVTQHAGKQRLGRILERERPAEAADRRRADRGLQRRRRRPRTAVLLRPRRPRRPSASRRTSATPCLQLQDREHVDDVIARTSECSVAP